MLATNIIYEQPITELMRVFLRLEYLFNRLQYLLEDFSSDHMHHAMQTLIETIHILDRPDLKSKVTQELHRYINAHDKLQGVNTDEPELAQRRLRALHNLLQNISSADAKIARNLRNNEFLATIRLNITNAGSGACIGMPAYKFWLNQDIEKNKLQFESWLQDFADIKAITELLLDIVRSSTAPKLITAEHGFYHESLQTSSHCQLLRVVLDRSANVYPEISAGKHRFTIRFLEFNYTEQTQTKGDIPFALCCCYI